MAKDQFVNLALLFVGLTTAVFLYRRMEDKKLKEQQKDEYESIRKHLLDEKTLVPTTTTAPTPTEKPDTRPILWIHVPYDYNARHWENFGSRSSFDLNQPYLYLTVKTIVARCKDSFRISIIDDSSFEKLIPDWKIQMNHFANPVKYKVRQMAIAKLLYVYGGLVCPISLVCMNDLISLYTQGITGGKMFVGEQVNRSISSDKEDKKFSPTPYFMGAEKGNASMNRFATFLEQNLAHDFTEESRFLGAMGAWLREQIIEKNITQIDGKLLGVKTQDDSTPILLENLLSQHYIDFSPDLYGILIPSHELLTRVQYGWFLRMSAEQVLEADTILSKYLVVSLAPQKGGEKKVDDRVYTPVGNASDFVSFWKMPSGAPVWGLKPNYLGNDLLKSES